MAAVARPGILARIGHHRGPHRVGLDEGLSGSDLGLSGRVDRSGCPPRPPSDPGMHITRTRFLTYDIAALRNRLWTTRGLGKP